MSESTTIRLKKTTKSELIDMGYKDESYDDIVQRLLKIYYKKMEAER